MNDLNITPETLIPLVQGALIVVAAVAAVALVVLAISNYRDAKKAQAQTLPGTEDYTRAEALTNLMKKQIVASAVKAAIGGAVAVLIALYFPALLSAPTPL